MRILLFGGSGMVGQGVLRECLLDKDVTSVVSVGRSKLEEQHPKLRQIVLPDLFDLHTVADELAGFDACFFPLGVSSAGMTEETYSRVTYELTVSIARTLVSRNPSMTFVYVSGAGTDSTERGRSMWARVKGRTENALFAIGFKDAYAMRPGLIQPHHGIISRTRVYRIAYTILGPILPLIRKFFPNAITTTEEVGRAMLELAKRGYPKKILGMRDIRQVASQNS